MSDSFAHSLYHICSPTLRKVKPSNLFTLHKERCPNWRADLEECRATLERFGFGVAVLEDNRRYVVVMVYHIASLRRCLGQREPMRWLDALGYSDTPSLEGKLERLEKRFHRDSFPHEISLFLGYPLEDVRGFIANQGRNSKYTGEWKVYGNLNDARRLFQSYKDSRRWVMEQAEQGKNLAEILSAC